MSKPDSWAYPDAWQREEALCQGLIGLRDALRLAANPARVQQRWDALSQLLGQEPAGTSRPAQELRMLWAAWRLRPSQTLTSHLCRLLEALQRQFELQARLFPLEEPDASDRIDVLATVLD